MSHYEGRVETFHYPPPPAILFLLRLSWKKLLTPLTIHLNSIVMQGKPSALLYAILSLLLWFGWTDHGLKHTADPASSLYPDRLHTLHPCSSLRPLLHPLVRPALIQSLISTLIPVLFQEHRDCLMIYWPDLSICTVNHNGPSTKEEPVGHALLSSVLPLNSRPPTSTATSFHPL